MNNANEQKTYVCKRARMCSFLIEKGFTPYKVAPDRDNPMYDVFLFTASPKLYEAVMEYINNRAERRANISPPSSCFWIRKQRGPRCASSLRLSFHSGMLMLKT